MFTKNTIIETRSVGCEILPLIILNTFISSIIITKQLDKKTRLHTELQKYFRSF